MVNVMVLGGTGGIGQAVVKEFCYPNGNEIWYTHKPTDPEIIRKFNSEILWSGNIARDVNFSIGNATFGSYDELMGELPTSIDYVINCIGVLRDRTLVKMTDEELDDVLDINLRSTIKLCQRIEPRIRRGGSITLISSIIGEIGGFGQCNYAASKAGIEAFTKSYAMEMARRNIRVNCVVPSIVDTGIFKLLTDEQKQKLIDRTLLKRMATIEEVAKFIKFIAVDATYCTGDILPITGGFR